MRTIDIVVGGQFGSEGNEKDDDYIRIIEKIEYLEISFMSLRSRLMEGRR